ncbi:zinc finger protein 674-like [Cydia fagiglandana]|uniref:zinc finger protein 674-like n=1 Tax=Cydia fagiglandana TaxID=1458189 RepID=UPI002FEE01EC
MVSTYYLVKLFQKATYERLKRNLDGVGESSTSGTSTTNNSAGHSRNILATKTCRVCLKEVGTRPIFGDESHSDISVAIRVFGDIDVKEEDDYPKYLCDACHTLLEAAILFRKSAKQSHQLLRKRHVKQEFHHDTQDGDPQETKEEKPRHIRPSILTNFFSLIDSPDNSNDPSKRKKTKVQCRICSKIITKAYYKEHFALHDATIVKYMCDVCGKSFRQRCAYKNHYFTHSTDFPYKCTMCPYRGRNSGLLNTHMRTHTGDYRYMCSECPARFLTKSNLNKHMFKHKEPMFKCDTCHRAFHSKLILERHYEAEHLGIKNHICNLCGKAFGYRKAMMRHQLDVHKREKKVNGRTPSYLEAEFKKQQDEIM